LLCCFLFFIGGFDGAYIYIWQNKCFIMLCQSTWLFFKWSYLIFHIFALDYTYTQWYCIYYYFWGLWLYGSWIYNYLCNPCLSPLMLWVRISIRARCTTLCDKVCQWLATGLWFSPGSLVSSTNKTEILLKMVLNTTKQTKTNTIFNPC
jgi:hypothetical protein